MARGALFFFFLIINIITIASFIIGTELWASHISTPSSCNSSQDQKKEYQKEIPFQRISKSMGNIIFPSAQLKLSVYSINEDFQSDM